MKLRELKNIIRKEVKKLQLNEQVGPNTAPVGQTTGPAVGGGTGVAPINPSAQATSPTGQRAGRQRRATQRELKMWNADLGNPQTLGQLLTAYQTWYNTHSRNEAKLPTPQQFATELAKKGLNRPEQDITGGGGPAAIPVWAWWIIRAAAAGLWSLGMYLWGLYNGGSTE